MYENFRIKEVVRSDRRRTISVKICADGGLIVRAPFSATDYSINRAIGNCTGWIIAQQKKLSERVSYTAFTGREGDAIFYLGEKYLLHFCDVKEPYYYGSVFFFPEKDKENVKEKLIAWYKARAREVLFPKTELYAKALELSLKAVGITSAKTRFGSCTGDNKINFSFRLMYYPLSVVDYVIIHELCHIIHHDHSEKFWKKVELFCPTYKKSEKYIKDNTTLFEYL